MSSGESYRDHDERRAYFRIDDSIRVEYQVLSEEDFTRGLPEFGASDGVDGNLSALARLHEITQQLAVSLRRIEQRDPDIADYLKGLDAKIDLVGRGLFSNDLDLINLPSRAVNLSAGGMALEAKDGLEIGTKVRLRLLLLPSYRCIAALGEVVRSAQVEDNPDYPIWLHINFTSIRGADQDALIKHILLRQGKILRERKNLEASA